MNWKGEIIRSFNWAFTMNLCLIVFYWVFMDRPWVENIWQFFICVVICWIVSFGLRWLEYLYMKRNGIDK